MSLSEFDPGDIFLWRGRETTPRMLKFGSGAVMAPMSSEKKGYVEIEKRDPSYCPSLRQPVGVAINFSRADALPPTRLDPELLPGPLVLASYL